MPKPMGSPEMRGQGSRSRPAPATGEPGHTLQAMSPAPALSRALRQGGRDREGVGQG